MLVKMIHHIRATVYNRRCLILRNVCYPVTAKSANFVLIDEVGCCIRIVIFVCRG